MAATLYGYPYDEELFAYRWRNEPDPITTALLNSGAMVANSEIASMVAGTSNLYTVPFYKVITGDPVNYDGATDIEATETEGGYQSGIVYGRAQAWKARDFIFDFHKGDPMGQIVSQVNYFWDKYRQTTLLAILEAVFGVTVPDDADDTVAQWYTDWANHITDLTSGSTEVSDDNKVGATTFADAAVNACGDLAVGQFGLAIMHSKVAANLAGTQLVEYRKYTDSMGIERSLPIADINGYTVVISDQVPYTAATDSSAATYTSYLLGNGAVHYAPASVRRPVEADRDPKTNGGEDLLYTRIRETMLPNGFSYTPASGDGVSPDLDTLGSSDRYSLIWDPKAIAMAKIVSNG